MSPPAPPYRTPAPRIEDEPPRPSTHDIGPLRRSHRALPLWRTLMGALLWVAMIVFVAVGAAGSAIDLRFLVLVLPFGAVGFLITGLRPLRERCLSVDLHADGVAVVRSRGREEIPFDDVDELWCRVELQSTQLGSFSRLNAVWLVDRAGQRHFVPLAVDDADKLASALLRRCSETLVTDALAAIAEGGTLTFGRVRISSQGIDAGRGFASWSEIRLVRLQPGRIALLRRFPWPWAVIRWENIPHPTLFARIVSKVAPRIEKDDPLAKGTGGDGAS